MLGFNSSSETVINPDVNSQAAIPASFEAPEAAAVRMPHSKTELGICKSEDVRSYLLKLPTIEQRAQEHNNLLQFMSLDDNRSYRELMNSPKGLDLLTKAYERRQNLNRMLQGRMLPKNLTDINGSYARFESQTGGLGSDAEDLHKNADLFQMLTPGEQQAYEQSLQGDQYDVNKFLLRKTLSALAWNRDLKVKEIAAEKLKQEAEQAKAAEVKNPVSQAPFVNKTASDSLTALAGPSAANMVIPGPAADTSSTEKTQPVKIKPEEAPVAEVTEAVSAQTPNIEDTQRIDLGSYLKDADNTTEETQNNGDDKRFSLKDKKFPQFSFARKFQEVAERSAEITGNDPVTRTIRDLVRQGRFDDAEFLSDGILKKYLELEEATGPSLNELARFYGLYNAAIKIIDNAKRSQAPRGQVPVGGMAAA